MPSKLSIASGLARGGKAFAKSYMQMEQMKHQQKMQKNSTLVDILLKDAEREDITYYERAKILDQIPELIGAKPDQPLSRLLGYDKLNEEDFLVSKGKAAEAGKVVVDENAPEGVANSIQLRGQEATIDVIDKRGNLTPREVKARLQTDLEKIRGEQKHDLDIKTVRATYEAQKEILGKDGFDHVVFKGFNKNKEYIEILRNSSGQTKTINLGAGVNPLELEKLDRKKPTGKFGALQEANQIISEYEADPRSHPAWRYEAAQNLLKELELTNGVKEETIKSLRLGNVGQKPPTAASLLANDDRDRGVEIKLQTDFDELSSKAIIASSNAAATAKLATDQAAEVKRLKDRMDKLKGEGKEETDDEYVRVENAYRTETNRYNDLKLKADEAKAQDEGLKELVGKAKANLGKYTSSSMPEITKYKPLIDVFRKSNQEKVKDLSDSQIYQILKNAGRIK